MKTHKWSDIKKKEIAKRIKDDLDYLFNSWHRPVPPGEVLLLDFILPSFANEVSMTVDDLQAIISGKKKINKTIAKALSKKYRTTEEFWLNLQKNYDAKKG